MGIEVLTPCPTSGFLATIVAAVGRDADEALGWNADAACAPKASHAVEVSGQQQAAAGQRTDAEEGAAVEARVPWLLLPLAAANSAIGQLAGQRGAVWMAFRMLGRWRTGECCRSCFTVDVGVGRPRLLRDQGRRGHDLAGLTVAALRHDLHPRALDGVRRASADRPSMVVTGADTVDTRLAGPCRTSPCTGERRRRRCRSRTSSLQVDDVAQHPEQRHVARHLDGMCRAVDLWRIGILQFFTLSWAMFCRRANGATPSDRIVT
ncbi:MAG: hypothetical protein R2712_27910 [Vicinamibacterales bacterium]